MNSNKYVLITTMSPQYLLGLCGKTMSGVWFKSLFKVKVAKAYKLNGRLNIFHKFYLVFYIGGDVFWSNFYGAKEYSIKFRFLNLIHSQNVN